MKVKNKLLNYKDLEIIQDSNHFNFCLDSVLLARFVTFNKKVKKIVDIGTNNAIIPLILSKYTKAAIYGVEIQEEPSILARKNIEANNLINQIEIINQDIKNFTIKRNNFCEIVVCNPPFFRIDENSNLNTKESLVIARHEKFLSLEEMIHFSRILLNNDGKLVFIHLAERFEDIIIALNKSSFSIKKIRFIYSKNEKFSNKILVEAKLSNNKGCKIFPPLYIHNDDGSYTNDVKVFFED
ncbi:methyltransferase [Spiroplasma corruscae]|uniref:Methyltransferase n=1 Tax=Spiroplasma corruscae TaxID=216934 RepID=A0A222EMT6_9MOLU|nr:methyltransferase [Spiroplasma corruscae]ASP27785.1 methyltransferase [Spiroplasma corruscae]